MEEGWIHVRDQPEKQMIEKIKIIEKYTEQKPPYTPPWELDENLSDCSAASSETEEEPDQPEQPEPKPIKWKPLPQPPPKPLPPLPKRHAHIANTVVGLMFANALRRRRRFRIPGG